MKLMVIDGNSIIHRSFYGIRPLTNHDGLYTHAVFGFLTALLRLEKQEVPDALCVVFDVHAPTFRHKADESYKSNRKPMPEELKMQIPVLKEVLDALNIPRYEVAGWEADDLLGTISRKCEAENWECVIVSGDRDVLQLITTKTKVKLITTHMRPVKDMTLSTFQEEYGFDPIHLIDLKALMGDASDNISGVLGIGKKIATTLIQTYGSINNLYEKIPDLQTTPSIIKKLIAGEENARHSAWLATIVTDVPLDFQPENNLRQAPSAAAYPLFIKLEFSTLIERFDLKPSEKKLENNTYSTIKLEDEKSVFDTVHSLLASGETVYICINQNVDIIVLYCGSSTVYILNQKNFSGEYSVAVQKLLTLPLVGHNIKDIQRILLSKGYHAGTWVFDTALAAYMLDATAANYDLERLCIKYCGFQMKSTNELEQLSLMTENTTQKALEEDFISEATVIAKLHNIFSSSLKEENMQDLYENAELPLCQVLAEMELTGCLVDKQALSDFGDMLSKRIAEQEKAIYDMAGVEFNINSAKQLGEVLFEKLGLPHGKKTKRGWSTSAEVLDKLRHQAPIVSAVLEYRQYAKLKSTYADGLLRAIDPDGRIRTSFQMTATATGRLSSSEPNLQNIPTKTDLGSQIRKMFIPASGRLLVDADYSQIELRLLAHISGDENMRRAFVDGIDVHTATAAQVFHVSPSEVTHEMRRRAKAVNFGIVYGISAFSLAQDINVSIEDARTYIETYFQTFPDIHRYMDEIKQFAYEKGYVETLFHRRRNLPELKSSHFNLRSFGERVALNTPIQGTAADIIKLAMVAVYKRLARENPSAKLALQVHDELIVECPEEEAESVAALLQEEMEHVVSLSVPLTAQAHWGRNWLEAKG